MIDIVQMLTQPETVHNSQYVHIKNTEIWGLWSKYKFYIVRDNSEENSIWILIVHAQNSFLLSWKRLFNIPLHDLLEHYVTWFLEIHLISEVFHPQDVDADNRPIKNSITLSFHSFDIMIREQSVIHSRILNLGYLLHEQLSTYIQKYGCSKCCWSLVHICLQIKSWIYWMKFSIESHSKK